MKSQTCDMYSNIAQYVGEEVYDATDSEVLAFIAYFGADVISRWAVSVLREMFQEWLRSLGTQAQPTATLQYGYTPIYQGFRQTGVF